MLTYIFTVLLILIMADSVSVRLSGEPVTWKRPVWLHNHVFNPNAHLQHQIEEQMRLQYAGELLRGPLRVEISFFFRRPQIHFIGGFERRADAPKWYMRKVDLDNLTKLVLDAMSGVLYEDDHQIVHLVTTKCYSDISVGYTDIRLTSAV